MSRRRLSLALALVAVLFVAACGEEVNRAGDVRAAIDETRSGSYRFTYSEDDPDGLSVVRGIVEDDFRYKAQLSVDDEPVLDEIALDDALAVRVLDDRFLRDFVDADLRGSVDESTDVEGIDVLSGLAAKRWILDPVGAPSQTSPERGLGRLGTDPVFDAFSVFEYVEQAIRESGNAVVEYSEENINPTYRRTEDLFSKPDKGSGVVRYDLARPRLPSIADLTSGQNTSSPSTRHFRKMAIYVKDGRLIRVEERVEVVGTFYKNFIDYQRDLLKEVGAPEEFLAGLNQLPSEMPESMPIEQQVELSTQILQGFNIGLELQGAEPIRIRHMIFDLQDLGDTSISIELPQGDDVINGSLAVLRNRGRKPSAAEVEGT